MALFSSKPSAESLKKKSGDIVEVFTSTINNLEAVNGEIEALAAEKTAEKERIEQELNKLSAQKADNGLIISKLKQIFQ